MILLCGVLVIKYAHNGVPAADLNHKTGFKSKKVD